MNAETLTLAADFPPASEADWHKLVDGVLKGAPFEKLVGKTYDGVPIAPLYPRAKSALPIAGRAAGTPWRILQRIDHPDPAQANAQALHDLENGATGLTLVFAGAPGARGFGLPSSPEAIAQLLDGVHLEAGIDIELELAPQGRDAAMQVISLIEQRKLDPATVNLRAGFDPIGAAASCGYSPESWQYTAPLFGDVIGKLSARGFKGTLAAASGGVIHDAGGTEAQELAFVLACGVAYLRAIESAGVPLEEACGLIQTRLSADADQFLTMAKFRAMRRLWARVEESCGLAPKPLFISAETAWRMLTQRDSAVNMLRATMATFAAGVAGADAITVLPHTLALGLPDPFARRVARNTQLVLLEESNLAKVGDPAAGSGAIETLTTRLCEQAWTLFQEIERGGGVMAALSQGVIQRHVAAAREARAKNIARRRDVLTGASEFPNLNEAMPAILTKPEAPFFTSPRRGEVGSRSDPGEGGSAADGFAPPHPKGEREQTADAATRPPNFEPLAPIRLVQPFETLRDRSDAIFAKTKARPRVLLVTLGSPADYTPRLTFAKSFFETGGIEAVEFNLPSADLSLPSPPSAALALEDTLRLRPLPTEDGGRGEKLATALAGASLVCLCSSDKVYASSAKAAAGVLHAAGAKHIYLAGKPGDLEATLRAAGVSDFIAAGGDAIATLTAAFEKIDR